MLSVYAGFETDPRREQSPEGIATVTGRDVYAGEGRKQTIDFAEVRRLKQDEKLGSAASAKRLGIGRASVYRVLSCTVATECAS